MYVSGQEKKELETMISRVILPDYVVLVWDDTEYPISTNEIAAKIDKDQTLNEIFNTHRKGNLFQRLITPYGGLIEKKVYRPTIDIDEKILDQKLSLIKAVVSEGIKEPTIDLIAGEVIIEKGEKGESFDIQEVKKQIIRSLKGEAPPKIRLEKSLQGKTLSDSEVENGKNFAEKYIDKKLVLESDGNQFVIAKADLVKLLSPDGLGFNEKEISDKADEIKTFVDRPPQNPVFRFEGGRVTEFKPAKDGFEVDIEKLKITITEDLQKLPETEDGIITSEIIVSKTPSEYQTSDVNGMGINTLLGVGTSKFTGSIASRVHNVALAASKFNGVLIKPGETFSFNKTLGDVSTFTGYQQAYVIKDGATVLGDGGGVCQVSTTLFRAALNSGLPISERRAHSYRVSYYEQDSGPGLDATVYDPSPDLKITNDTPGHLLIQTETNTSLKTLRFEIYGTSDGRIATISKPQILSTTPPPEDLYIDDPTLPVGQVKQIDWKAWGAKVSFKYHVERDGETLIDKTYLSTYQPWQAKYLRGAKTN